jgi:arsenite-transporting ATPase
LALLAVRDLAATGDWDVVVLDCAPTAETLRLLALPEALSWYLQRVFPLHRTLARGVRPLAAVLGQRSLIPPEAAFEAVLRLAEELDSVRALLADPDVTSVRLVLTPEAVVTAEARRTFTALALYGYRVDEVVANRVFPADDAASAWQRDWIAAQRRELDALPDSFAGLAVRELAYLPAEPIGEGPLRTVADALYGALPGHDPISARDAEPLLSVTAVSQTPEFVLTLALPLVEIGEVQASRSGDDLIVTVAGHRRVLSLPSVLRRCEVTGGSVTEGRLELHFVPDRALWPA